MASNWNYKDYQFSNFCLEKCTLPIVLCPLCGENGHEAYHKDDKNAVVGSKIKTKTVVNHAHFIEGANIFDKARNYWHEIKIVEVSKEYYEMHYRLPHRDRMKKEFINKMKITKDDYHK